MSKRKKESEIDPMEAMDNAKRASEREYGNGGKRGRRPKENPVSMVGIGIAVNVYIVLLIRFSN